MDIVRSHPEAVEYGRESQLPSTRKLQAYSGSEACGCVARAEGADVALVGSMCRCEHHKNELRDLSGNKELVRKSIEVLSPWLLSRSTSSSMEGTEPGELGNTNEAPEPVLEMESPIATPISGDLSSSPASSDSSSIDTTATINTAPSANDSYNETASKPSTSLAPVGAMNSGGLSNSGKIGLGVGLGLGIALFLAAMAFFCLARRRNCKAVQQGTKYTPHARSDLSIIEQSHPIQMKAEQTYGPQSAERQPLQGFYRGQPDAHDSQVYYEPPPVNVFQTPAGHSAVAPIDVDIRGNDRPRTPLALMIPGEARKPGISREQSPVRSHSPVSPVSPLSALSLVSSRPPSPKAK